MRNDVYEAYQGAAKSWTVTLRDDNGDPVTTHSSGDSRTVYAFTGDNQASAYAPTATWLSAGSGTLTLSLAAATTATESPGWYQLVIDIGSGPARYHLGRLRLLAAPGAAPAIATYCSYDNMRQLAGAWIDDLVEMDSGQTDFAEQRGLARKWFDALLQRHYRRNTVTPRTDTFDDLLAWGVPWRVGEHSAELQTWLDADRLVLTTPSGQTILDACAYYAIHLVCQSQVSKRADDIYQDRSRLFLGRANELAITITAEVDTTTIADGVGDLLIDLGVVDRLRA